MSDPTRDLSSGDRLDRRDAPSTPARSGSDFAPFPELLFDAAARGLRAKEAPIRPTRRVKGSSGTGFRETSRRDLGSFPRRVVTRAAR